MELKKHLKAASRKIVCDTVPRLERNWETNRWLSGDNSYREDVAREIGKGTLPVEAFSYLSEYIAASAILHCFDGWSYLSRALESEMAADPDTARHLGYYAELRAAMSLMASEGIGVFHDTHIVLTEGKTCEEIKDQGATHKFAWSTLETWAGLPESTGTVLRTVSPGGLALEDWLEKYSSGATFLTSEWLKQWGLDLSRLAEDRNARNLASYRATTFTSSGPEPINETMDSVLEFWKVCDPGAGGGFPVLDKHLLRISLESLFENKHGRSPEQEGAKYREEMQTMLDDLPLSPQSRDRWMKFLNREVEKDPLKIVTDAEGTDEPSHSHHSKQVLARAALLLRVATGSAGDILAEAGSDVRTKLNFWLHSASVRRRLWDKASPPMSFQDLWSDVEDAAEAVRKWMNDGGQSRCHYDFWAANAAQASVLSTAERVFLWGARL